MTFSVADFKELNAQAQSELIFKCGVSSAQEAEQFVNALATHRVDNSDFYAGLLAQDFERSQVEAMARYGVEMEIAWASSDYGDLGREMRQWCGITHQFAVSRRAWLAMMMEAPENE